MKSPGVTQPDRPTLLRILFPMGERPLGLLAERHHPLVRAEFSRTLKSCLVWCAFCLLVPLGCTVAMIALRISGGATPGTLGTLIGCAYLFVAGWPLAMIVCASVRSYLAVRDEKNMETAWQVALTPMPRRVVAAAKTLPYVLPSLCGILASAYMYLVFGSTASPTLGIMPTPLLVWPFRTVGPIMTTGGLHSPDLITLAGGPAGAVMWLTDLGWVWAAAQWGAVLGLRYDNVFLAVGHFLAKLLWTLWIFLGYVGVIGLLVVVPCFWLDNATPSKGVVTPAQLMPSVIMLVLLFLWWRRWLASVATRTVGEFSSFDRLAVDGFEAGRAGKVPGFGGGSSNERPRSGGRGHSRL